MWWFTHCYIDTLMQKRWRTYPFLQSCWQNTLRNTIRSSYDIVNHQIWKSVEAVFLCFRIPQRKPFRFRALLRKIPRVGLSSSRWRLATMYASPSNHIIWKYYWRNTNMSMAGLTQWHPSYIPQEHIIPWLHQNPPPRRRNKRTMSPCRRTPHYSTFQRMNRWSVAKEREAWRQTVLPMSLHPLLSKHSRIQHPNEEISSHFTWKELRAFDPYIDRPILFSCCYYLVCPKWLLLSVSVAVLENISLSSRMIEQVTGYVLVWKDTKILHNTMMWHANEHISRDMRKTRRVWRKLGSGPAHCFGIKKRWRSRFQKYRKNETSV